MSRPYLVYSFDFYEDSAGQKVMHRLCHELNLASQEAYVGFERRNPAWQTPYHKVPLEGDWIAVYPEIVTGNPWRAPHVARWVLNVPGRLGGEKTYAPSEEVFVYSEMFNTPLVPPERILYLPAIELDIYTDQGVPRQGAVYYIGKAHKSRDVPGAVEITADLKRDRALLAATLNRAELLYCFDNSTAMAQIARLCGCPVWLVPDGSLSLDDFNRHVRGPGIAWDARPVPFDSAVVRAAELAAYDTFRERLADFVRITQA